MRPDVPHNTRRAVYARAQGRCEDCGERAKQPLELHHLRYTNDGDVYDPPGTFSILGIEKPTDLVALCRGCHQARHTDPNGDFWRDPQDMADHWEAFYEAQERDE